MESTLLSSDNELGLLIRHAAACINVMNCLWQKFASYRISSFNRYSNDGIGACIVKLAQPRAALPHWDTATHASRTSADLQAHLSFMIDLLTHSDVLSTYEHTFNMHAYSSESTLGLAVTGFWGGGGGNVS